MRTWTRTRSRWGARCAAPTRCRSTRSGSWARVPTTSSTASATRGSGCRMDECFAATRALCNVCGRLGDAKIAFAGERVHLVKWCPDHGETRALVSSSREWYLRSLAYVKPGTSPRSRSVERLAECPDACGLCPRHQQHTCVPL